MKRLLKNVKESIHEVILTLFNMQDLLNVKRAPATSSDPFWFVKREKHQEEVVEAVLEFTVDFIREVLGEK